MARTSPLLVVLLVLMANTAEAAAQWQLGVGLASIHSGSKTGGLATVGFLWSLDGRGVLRVGGLGSIGTADQGYTTVGVDAELHPIQAARVSPFVGVRYGALIEPEFRGGVVTGVAGILFPLRDNLGMRVEGGWSTHGARPGPNFALVALELGR